MAEVTVKKGDKEISAGTGEKTVANAERMRGANTLDPMDRLLDRMDRLFEGYYPRGLSRALRREWPSWGDMNFSFQENMPNMDVIDRDNEIVVQAELPGVDKENLDISLSETAITVKGTTQREEKEEKGDFYRREMSRGSFTRTVSLPSKVDGAKAKASFKDGVLEVILPKLESAKRHTIKVD
jgi:HSP20 family protein